MVGVLGETGGEVRASMSKDDTVTFEVGAPGLGGDGGDVTLDTGGEAMGEERLRQGARG